MFMSMSVLYVYIGQKRASIPLDCICKKLRATMMMLGTQRLSSEKATSTISC